MASQNLYKSSDFDVYADRGLGVFVGVKKAQRNSNLFYFKRVMNGLHTFLMFN